jgi:hypothetical protein
MSRADDEHIEEAGRRRASKQLDNRMDLLLWEWPFVCEEQVWAGVRYP